MAAECCRNEDGLPGKEGAELHRFIYGEFLNIYEKFIGYLKQPKKIVFHVSE